MKIPSAGWRSGMGSFALLFTRRFGKRRGDRTALPTPRVAVVLPSFPRVREWLDSSFLESPNGNKKGSLLHALNTGFLPSVTQLSIRINIAAPFGRGGAFRL